MNAGSIRQRAVTIPGIWSVNVRLVTALAYLFVGGTALLPRVWSLGRFVTFDEVNFWMHRSGVFLNALQHGDFAATAVTDHPGVTTMWLGSAGILLQQALTAWGILPDPSFAVRLALMQLPVGLTHALGVVIGYWLLRRLLDGPTALLAALLWALDPFVIAYSRVLHVDALAGTFATLGLLAACAFWHHTPRPALLVLSGVCAGLAALSKSPALALFPLIGLIGLAGAAPAGESSRPWSGAWRPLLAWGAIVAITVVVVWPAVWAAPSAAVRQIWIGYRYEGSQPHPQGNYFLGQPDKAPGMLFYPVALALRTTPWTLLGLLLLALGLRQAPRATRRDIAALACFVIIFTVLMGLLAKKFNRYLLPAFPSVDILAAIGLLGGLRWWRDHAAARGIYAPRPILVLGLVAAVAVGNVVSWHPYEIAAFNQLLGGAPAGAYAFKAGWGEGLEQAAEWLNQQLDITTVKVATLQTQPLHPYLRYGGYAVGTEGDVFPDKTGYVVVYVSNVQSGEAPPPYDRFYGRVTPLHVVSIYGVPYVWIYQMPPDISHSLAADFGPAIALRGFDVAGDARPGATLTLRLFWMPRAVPAADYTLFVHLLGKDGRHLAQADLPLPTSKWSPGQYFTTTVPLTVPAGASGDENHLVIGLYDSASGHRLALTQADPLDSAIDGPDVLKLTGVVIR